MGTFMDRYIILGFYFILTIGGCLGITSWLTWLGNEDDYGYIILALEYVVTGIIVFTWICGHIYFFCWRNLYTPWPDIYEEENQKLIDICDTITKERQQIIDCKFNTGEKPDPPPADWLAEYEAGRA